MVYSAGRLFQTGGISYNGGILDGIKVFSAPASDVGTLGAWTPEPALPEAVYYHTSAAVNGFIYILGGFHYTDADGIVVSNVVYRAAVNPDGSTGAWQADTPLPQPVFFPSAASWNGRIYVTGGWNGTALINAVYSAEVRTNGSLGPWVAQKPLPQAVYTHAAVSNGTLYVLGGTVNGGADIQNTVYWSKINADGSLANWAAAPPLPAPVSNHGAVVANGRIFALGGWTGAAPTAAVNSSLIAADGGLGGWTPEALLPRPLYLLATAASPSHIFVSGGIDNEAIRSEVYSLPLPPPPPPDDGLPPRTSLAFAGPLFDGMPFISTATVASLSAVDDARVVGDGAGVGVASTQWALDDGVFDAYTAPISIHTDGGHWIRFMSVDMLGHAEAVRASSAAVDGTAPVSSLSVGAPRAVLATGEVIIGPATSLAVSAADPVVNGAASGIAWIRAGVDEAAPAPVDGTFLLPAADGPHSVSMQASDNVGNVEAAHVSIVYRDAARPQTSLTLSSPAFTPADGGAPIVGARTLLSFSAQDHADSAGVAAGVHHTEYALDGGAASLYTGAFSLAEGEHTLSYHSVDNVGNAEAWRSATYRSDVTLAQSTLSWEGAPGSPTPETAFTLSALDPASNGVASGVRQILYSVDGGPDQVYAQPFQLALGRHTLAYAACDNAGNVEERNSATVVVGAADDLPPRTTLAFGAPMFGAIPFISPDTPVTLTAVDDARAAGDGTGVGVAFTRWALDDGAFADYTTPIRIAADGAHWIRFLSVDAAGHAEAVRASSAAVDGTAPVSALSIGSPQALLASGEVIVGPGAEIAVTAVDPVVNGAASGIASTRVGVDGSALVPGGGAFLLPSADGAHSVSMQAADNVGNAEAVHAATVYRDGTPPATMISFSAAPYAGPSGPVYGASTALSFTAADPASGGTAAGVHHTEYALDGGAASPYTGAFGLAEGEHALFYHSVDNVGNTEAAQGVSFAVDATPPQTNLAVDGGTTLFGVDVLTASAALSLSATDPISNATASGVKRVVYSADGGADQAYAAAFHLAVGAHTLSYGAVDNAGNVEPRKMASLSVGTFLADALAGLDSVSLSGKAGVTGSVRTNGAFTANGKSMVTGDVSAMTADLRGQSTVSGSVTQGRATLSSSSYDLESAAAQARARNDNAALPAGLLNGGALILTGGSRVLAAGDYYLTGLHLSGQARLSVSGRVNIFLHGPLSVLGGAELNSTGEANDLWIISDADDASLSGHSRSAFNLYAPLSAVSIVGSGEFAGRVLARTASLSGKTLQPSTSSLPAARHDSGPAAQSQPPDARKGEGTAGGGHAAGRDSAVASSRLDAASPSVAARGSSAPSAGTPSGPAPARAAASQPGVPREPKRLAAAASPQPGAGTAGPGRSAGREAVVASSRLEREDPRRESSGDAVLPPIPDLAAAAPDARARNSRTEPSRMPSFPLTARAAFSAVGPGGSVVRAEDRSAVVIPEGAAPTGLAVTVSPPKTSALVENNRQAAVEARKGLVAAASGVQYGPEGVHFTKPVTLELPYVRARLPAGVYEKDLFVHYWNPVNGDWEKLESSVDAQNQIVRAQTTHFSLYRIFGGGSNGASAPESVNDPSFAVHAGYAFPNPARGASPVVIRIQPGLADSVSVRVYDLSGRLVHESSDFRNRGSSFDDGNGFGFQFTFDHTWDVSGVGSGVYNFIVTGRKAGETDIRMSGKVAVIK
ncbi:MAG: hypothetical protein A2X37_00540 [Elusimicrobia bacterium GWA2_66_18]|nr:MAG: hypothetical protein A2X37_00540 [Elusimicrobia bacterium GWA2_66_18]